MSLSSTLAKLLHQLNLSILVHTSTKSISVLLSPYRESGAASGTATWAAWQARILPSGTGCQHLDHRITNDRAVPGITTVSFCTPEDGGHTVLQSTMFCKSWRISDVMFDISICFILLFLSPCAVQMLILWTNKKKSSSYYLRHHFIRSSVQTIHLVLRCRILICDDSVCRQLRTWEV